MPPTTSPRLIKFGMGLHRTVSSPPFRVGGKAEGDDQNQGCQGGEHAFQKALKLGYKAKESAMEPGELLCTGDRFGHIWVADGCIVQVHGLFPKQPGEAVEYLITQQISPAGEIVCQ